MKKYFFIIAILVFTGSFLFNSCKKEESYEGCKESNKPPTAIAGPDQVITLPTDSVSLDGNASSDPDGRISEWLWIKVEGPASFAIANTTAAKTVVKNLTNGVYQFELKVPDNGCLSLGFNSCKKETSCEGCKENKKPPIAIAGPDRVFTLPPDIFLFGWFCTK